MLPIHSVIKGTITGDLFHLPSRSYLLRQELEGSTLLIVFSTDIFNFPSFILNSSD
jgi:hypothetical protein